MKHMFHPCASRDVDNVLASAFSGRHCPSGDCVIVGDKEAIVRMFGNGGIAYSWQESDDPMVSQLSKNLQALAINTFQLVDAGGSAPGPFVALVLSQSAERSFQLRGKSAMWRNHWVQAASDWR